MQIQLLSQTRASDLLQIEARGGDEAQSKPTLTLFAAR